MPRIPYMHFLDRLATYADRPNECWLWPGALTNGYGTASWHGQRIYAHRLAYELLVGPIPEGFDLDHVRARGCTHRHCFNPAHLEPVTRRENLLRGDTIPAKNTTKTHCPHGHPYSDENVRRNHGGRQCRACHRARALTSYHRQKRDAAWVEKRNARNRTCYRQRRSATHPPAR